MSYIKTNWQDLPNTSTPINATNLNKSENAIYDLALDSGWVNVTYPNDSEFENYSTSGDKLSYRKFGKLVEIRGIITPKSGGLSAGWNSHKIFQLPSGYRPSGAMDIVQQGNGVSRWSMHINTNGVVDLTRFGGGTDTTPPAVTAGTWLPVHALFMID